MPAMIDIPRLALDARERIRPHIRYTPLEPSVDLGEENGGTVFLKLENVQHTGSFKVRGALNRLLALEENEKRAGVVTASSGNHGMATAFGMNRLGIDGVIYLPENASQLKVRALQRLGTEVRFYGSDCEATETHARRQAEQAGRVYISPYNDPLVVGGQGTIGLEILDRLPEVDAIMVSVGGGGLISGIAGVAKAQRRAARMVGCLPGTVSGHGRIGQSRPDPGRPDPAYPFRRNGRRHRGGRRYLRSMPNPGGRLGAGVRGGDPPSHDPGVRPPPAGDRGGRRRRRGRFSENGTPTGGPDGRPCDLRRKHRFGFV